jgi:hypothetical protein
MRSRASRYPTSARRRTTTTPTREVLPKGYISWREPVSGVWWQLRRFEDRIEYKSLDGVGPPATGTRAYVDHVTPPLQEVLAGEAAADPRRDTAWQRRRWRRRQNAWQRSLRETITALQRGEIYPPATQ